MQKIIDKILDLIFPQKCILCKNISSELICNNCYTETFKYYGEQSQLKLGIEYLSIFKYETNIKPLLEELKFKKNMRILSYLQNALLKAMPELKDIDLIIPVPLNPERFKERGFNQSELLIKKYAQIHNIPLRTDILYRQYNTKKSFTLSPQERHQQAQKAFAVWENKKGDVSEKNILLFDDIITTGNTIREIVNVLAPLGPKNIKAVCFSRPTQKNS